MNEELVKRLNKYLDTLEQTVSETSTLAEVELPLLVEEFLRIKTVEYTMWMSMIGIATVLVWFFVYKSFKWSKEELEKEHSGDSRSLILPYWSFPCYLASLIGLIITPCFIISVYYVTKVTIAPRIVILEELRRWL